MNCNIKVVVGIISFDGIEPQFLECFNPATNPPCGVEVIPRSRVSLNTCEARNEIVQDAIIINADYILFMDVDMIFPEGVLKRLLSAGKDIIGGFYIRKVSGFLPNLFKIAPDGTMRVVWFNKDAGIQKVDGIGTGCLLIKTSVFKEMEYPWFYYRSSKDCDRLMTEDTVFCEDAAAKGYDIFCDPNIRCGHIGKFIVTPYDYEPNANIKPIR